MKYYSTNKKAPLATLEEAVVKGLAGDKGLYMPEHIVRLDEGTINNMKNQSFHEIACTVAQAFFGEDIDTGNIGRDRKRHSCRSTPQWFMSTTIYTALNCSTALHWHLKT